MVRHHIENSIMAVTYDFGATTPRGGVGAGRETGSREGGATLWEGEPRRPKREALRESGGRLGAEAREGGTADGTERCCGRESRGRQRETGNREGGVALREGEPRMPEREVLWEPRGKLGAKA